MEFHLTQAGAVGRRKELEQGMAGQRDDLHQRYLEEVRAYVQAADELGYAGYKALPTVAQLGEFCLLTHGLFRPRDLRSERPLLSSYTGSQIQGGRAQKGSALFVYGLVQGARALRNR
jgi:hypothetical protein